MRILHLALLAALPKVQAITLQGSGHMMMAERPNETLDALIAALR